MVWLEIDLYDLAGLNLIRRSARTPIASLESIYGRRNFRPYFEHQSVDYAIIVKVDLEPHHAERLQSPAPI